MFPWGAKTGFSLWNTRSVNILTCGETGCCQTGAFCYSLRFSSQQFLPLQIDAAHFILLFVFLLLLNKKNTVNFCVWMYECNLSFYCETQLFSWEELFQTDRMKWYPANRPANLYLNAAMVLQLWYLTVECFKILLGYTVYCIIVHALIAYWLLPWVMKSGSPRCSEDIKCFITELNNVTPSKDYETRKDNK